MEDQYRITVISSNTPGVQAVWTVRHSEFPDLFELLMSKLGHPTVDYVVDVDKRGKKANPGGEKPGS